MNIRYNKPDGARHPRQLFVLVNEFKFDSFTIRPRYMGLAGARTVQNRSRGVRRQAKGGQPCQQFSC